MLTTLYVSSLFLLVMQKKPLPKFWGDHYIVSSLHDEGLSCSFLRLLDMV